MKRNCNSNRSKKWFNRNNLSNLYCKYYVENLCNIEFEFDYYEFIKYKGYNALHIIFDHSDYFLYADEYEVSLISIKELNNKELSVEKFDGDTCWYDSLFWIKNMK